MGSFGSTSLGAGRKVQSYSQNSKSPLQKNSYLSPTFSSLNLKEIVWAALGQQAGLR